jgi:hypothetical protein
MRLSASWAGAVARRGVSPPCTIIGMAIVVISRAGGKAGWQRTKKERPVGPPFFMRRDDYTFRNTRVPLVPPKPKELESATSIFMRRASFGT